MVLPIRMVVFPVLGFVPPFRWLRNFGGAPAGLDLDEIITIFIGSVKFIKPEWTKPGFRAVDAAKQVNALSKALMEGMAAFMDALRGDALAMGRTPSQHFLILAYEDVEQEARGIAVGLRGAEQRAKMKHGEPGGKKAREMETERPNEERKGERDK